MKKTYAINLNPVLFFALFLIVVVFLQFDPEAPTKFLFQLGCLIGALQCLEIKEKF